MATKLQEIYLDDDEDSFIVGYQVMENATQLLIVSVNENGQIDSVENVNQNHITRVVDDSAYLDFCQFMVQINQENQTYDPFHLADMMPKTWQTMDRFLAECQGEQRLVSVIAESDVLSGRVSMISEHEIGLQLVDFESVTFGAPKLVEKSDISVVDYVSLQNEYVNRFWQEKSQRK